MPEGVKGIPRFVYVILYNLDETSILKVFKTINNFSVFVINGYFRFIVAFAKINRFSGVDT